MTENLTTLSEADVLRELEAFAPQVNAGIARAGEPSASVLDAIHAEAVRVAAEKRRSSSRFHVIFRRVAAAAVFAVLLTGSFQTWRQYHHQSAHNQAVALLRISFATEDGNGIGVLPDTADLAQFLLTMQGLDDSFFSLPDEAELLVL